MSRAHPPTRLLRCGVPDEAERGLAKAILLGVALISPGAVALLGRPQPVVPRSTCGAWCTRGRNGNRGLSLQIAAAFRSATSTGTIPNPALLAAKLTGTVDVSQCQTLPRQFTGGAVQTVGGTRRSAYFR